MSILWQDCTVGMGGGHGNGSHIQGGAAKKFSTFDSGCDNFYNHRSFQSPPQPYLLTTPLMYTMFTSSWTLMYNSMFTSGWILIYRKFTSSWILMYGKFTSSWILLYGNDYFNLNIIVWKWLLQVE